MVIVEHLLEKFKIIDTNRRKRKKLESEFEVSIVREYKYNKRIYTNKEKRKNIKSEFEVVIVEHVEDLIYLLRSQVVFVNVY